MGMMMARHRAEQRKAEPATADTKPRRRRKAKAPEQPAPPSHAELTDDQLLQAWLVGTGTEDADAYPGRDQAVTQLDRLTAS